ncbi:DnaD domain protein [Enterococcus faecalis]|uniref:DnaD domain-containing protein n=1 Tax=Enterococcus faecalis TaxID=1351 RepID=UPI003CFF7857
MAQRRMFSKKITDTDLFLDMPMSAQCLYFHLNMEADDDGFLGNAKTVRRKIGASEDDLKILMAKEFIIPFESGVVVIKDWKIHNYIQKDRYNKTMFFEEKSMLTLDKNNSYQFMDTECIQDVSSLDTQVRLGKDRLELGKGSSREEGLKKIYHYYESNGFGTLAQKTMQDFDYWITDFEKIGATQENAVELIIHALGIAIDRNKRNYGYANAILKDWEQNRYLTVKDVEANDMMREQKKIIEEQKSNTGHSEYDDLGF